MMRMLCPYKSVKKELFFKCNVKWYGNSNRVLTVEVIT
jgi:hypothetical protein